LLITVVKKLTCFYSFPHAFQIWSEVDFEEMNCPVKFSVWYSLQVIFLSVLAANGELVVNVKNQGGDILHESLFSNITGDTVQLEFLKADGTLVTQFLDFQKGVQIYRLMILYEEEQSVQSVVAQVPYQTVCFVTKLSKQDFIAADAIAKLRQKNPNTIRTAEEDLGKDNSTFDYSIDVHKSNVISTYIRPLCREAAATGAIYAQEADLKFWASLGNPAEAFMVLDAVEHLSGTSGRAVSSSLGRCKDTNSTAARCNCRLDFCVPWYPCGLKFCRGHDVSGKVLSYRCGIKSCRKCLYYQFLTNRKEFCRWDN